MIKIAIVEDCESDVGILEDYLARYGKENDLRFDIAVYRDGMQFVSGYKVSFDVILMDIDMPILNGMEAARKLREMDEVTQLMFITNLSQYAINGYEVDACDYIVKPVSYYSFALRFSKAVNRVKKSEDYVVAKKNGGIVKIYLDTVQYVEVTGHMLVYHTTAGDIAVRGTISALEKQLSSKNFARCNNHYLVNLARVTSVKGLTVSVDNSFSLAISRSKRSDFRERLNMYEMDCATASKL